ncbi:MAG: site-specific integrase [Acidimicrobiales bacterium]
MRKALAVCAGRDFDAQRDTALVRLMLDVGARVGELAAMTVSSWNRDTDRVTLTGKTGTLQVPVSASTGEALSPLRTGPARPRSSDTPRLLARLPRGGGLGVSGIEQALARRCTEAGVHRIHPHQLRHKGAHLAKLGGPSDQRAT